MADLWDGVKVCVEGVNLPRAGLRCCVRGVEEVKILAYVRRGRLEGSGIK